MKLRLLSAFLVSCLVCCGFALSGPAVQAADPEAVGYASVPRNPDGSFDFTGWTRQTSSNYGETSFTRNDIDYRVRVMSRQNGSPLVANYVNSSTSSHSWTYSYFHGSGETSHLFAESPTISRVLQE